MASDDFAHCRKYESLALLFSNMLEIRPSTLVFKAVGETPNVINIRSKYLLKHEGSLY